MATLGSLVIQLQADLARLNSDMSKAVGIVDGAMASIRNAAGIAKSALGGLAVGLVGGLGAGALTASIKAVVDYGDRLNDLSKATGASVEQLSFLDYAAKQSGSTLEGLVGGISRLQKNLSEVAKGGGKAAGAALQELGLSARQLSQLDLVSQLSSLGEALNRIKNPSERAALAQAVFGKSARDIIPLLSEGEAGVRRLADRFVELGGVVTQGQAEAFDALNDSITDFNIATQAVGRNIAQGLAGPLTGFFESLANAPQTVSDSLTKITALFGVWVQELKVKLAEADIATAEGLRDLLPGSFGDSRLNQRIADAEARLRAARAALRTNQELLDYEKGPGGGGAAVLGGKPGGFTAIAEGVSDEQQKAADKLAESQTAYIDGLRKQLALQDQTTQAARVQADIAFGAAGKFDQATQATAAALAEQIDLLADAKKLREESAEVEEYMAGLVRERAQLEAKAVSDLAQKRGEIIDSLRTPLEKYVDTVKELTDPQLGLGGDTIQRGIAKARDEMTAAQDKANGLKDVAQELGLTFTSAFEDAIIAGKSFSDILQGIAQDIARLFIRKSITEPLVGALSGALSGGFGNLFGGGGGGGGFSNPAALFGNAAGGLYRVGGSGSEHPVAFTARAGEYVAVGTRMASGGGDAPQVVVYNQTPSDVNARRGADGRSIEVFVTSALERNVSRGGSRLGLKPPIATR